MKSTERMVTFVMIIALLGQGIFPGMILCRGDEGHFAVETMLERCCSAFVQAPSHLSLSLLYEPESATNSTCGPCADTLIPANAVRMPAYERHLGVVPAQVAPVLPSGIAFQAKRLFVSIFNPTELALIPIKTTFLLL